MYPTWRYFRDGRALVVNSPEEEKALGPGWKDTPDPKAFAETKAAKPAPGPKEAKPE